MSTLTIWPSTFSGLGQSAGLVCPRAMPLHIRVAATSTAGTLTRFLIEGLRYPLLVVLGDVIDGAGRRADPDPDQRALARAVTRAGADGGAGPAPDGASGNGPAGGGHQAEHRQAHTQYRDARPHRLHGRFLLFLHRRYLPTSLVKKLFTPCPNETAPSRTCSQAVFAWGSAALPTSLSFSPAVFAPSTTVLPIPFAVSSIPLPIVFAPLSTCRVASFSLESSAPDADGSHESASDKRTTAIVARILIAHPSLSSLASRPAP